MPHLTESHGVLDNIQQKTHPTWARKVWTRRGLKAISIPMPVTATHNLEKSQLVTLVATQDAKLYIDLWNPTPDNLNSLKEELGTCLFIETRLKATGPTIFFTFPRRAVMFGKCNAAGTILFQGVREKLYKLIPIEERTGQHG